MKATSVLLLALLTLLPADAAELPVTGKYLHLPVITGDAPQMVQLLDGAETVRYFEVSLPRMKDDALFWSTTDVSAFQGKTLQVVTEDEQFARDLIALSEQSGEIRYPANVYQEPLRPQFHFTPAAGWTNDPNGLVYHDGEYHLFFQHNPYFTTWGNMTWGHAVSKDLIHWKEIGDALLADEMGTMFSGSAVIDRNNTAGFGANAMLAFYTAAGGRAPKPVPFTQAMAWSTDRGRTWTKYEDNPVVDFLAKGNRDPKVFWHEASSQWVMALYLTRGQFVLYGSQNLRDWNQLSEVPFPDGHECPEFFELPVDGDPNNTRWVFWEGAGRHLIGRFDGKSFTPESEVLPSEWGANSYAGQTYNDDPKGRRVLVTWMRAGNGFDDIYEGMPFNQQMSIPREVSLRSTGQGIRLFQTPVEELAGLRGESVSGSNLSIEAANARLATLSGDLFDFSAVLDAGGARSVSLDVRGTRILWSPSDGTLSCKGKTVKLDGITNKLDLRVLVDRTSLEIFAAEGRYVMSFCFRPSPRETTLTLHASGGAPMVERLSLHEMNSIW
jgi:sucrose-6-phosphate hydrolase SacC (GH32 family)